MEAVPNSISLCDIIEIQIMYLEELFGIGISFAKQAGDGTFCLGLKSNSLSIQIKLFNVSRT